MTIYCEYCGLLENDCICDGEHDDTYDMQCPNCGAILSMDEMIQERCYACGYSENEYDIGHYDDSDRFDLVE